MIIICARFCDHIDLPAVLCAVFRIVSRAVNAVLLDGILRDLQADLRFLSLLLNSAGVYSIEAEIIVVTGVSSEANGALVAPAIILREGCEQRQAGPVAAI